MAGHDVLTIQNRSLFAAVPVGPGPRPSGALLATLSPKDTERLLSSRIHEGGTRLWHRQHGVLFDGRTGRSVPSSAAIESTKVPVSGFPLLAISSAIVAPKAAPFANGLLGFLLIALLAHLIILVFGIYIAARLVAGPFNQLITKIQSMHGQTDSDERLVVEGPHELQTLALAFNRAADRRAELMASLEVAQNNERETGETQQQFVSLVSHEFRTPLAIIDGQAQRIRRRIDREPREGIAASMDKCRASVARLVGLIDRVLNSSRFEAGAIDFQPEACDTGKLLADIVKAEESISPSHRIICDIDRLPKSIAADDKMLRQVFTNLIGNAVKYSPKASMVWIEGRKAGEHAVIAIRDQGVGIPENEIDKLFGRFFRASTASGIAGTGIGLHLVKQLVEIHGGEISVTSVEGEGTTFTVKLPVDRPTEAAEAA